MRTKLVVSYVAVLALAACGKGGGGRSTAELFDRMEASRTKACACTDAGCGQQARRELDAWMDDNPELLRHARTLPAAEQERFAALGQEAETCLDRLLPGPAAPPSAAPDGDAAPTPPTAPPSPDGTRESREPPPVPATPETVEPPPTKPTPAMSNPTQT